MQLKEKFGDDKSLATLRAALEEVNFEEVAYDKDYIAKAMGWVTPEVGPPQVPPAAEPPRPAPSSSPPPGILSLPFISPLHHPYWTPKVGRLALCLHVPENNSALHGQIGSLFT